MNTFLLTNPAFWIIFLLASYLCYEVIILIIMKLQAKRENEIAHERTALIQENSFYAKELKKVTTVNEWLHNHWYQSIPMHIRELGNSAPYPFNIQNDTWDSEEKYLPNDFIADRITLAMPSPHTNFMFTLFSAQKDDYDRMVKEIAVENFNGITIDSIEKERIDITIMDYRFNREFSIMTVPLLNSLEEEEGGGTATGHE